MEKKKGLHLAKFEEHLYCFLLGRENKRLWRFFNERQSTKQLASAHAWHEYAKVLYDITGQPPIPHPHVSPQHESTFTPQNVRNDIKELEFGKVLGS